jgi:hypothetical protein
VNSEKKEGGVKTWLEKCANLRDVSDKPSVCYIFLSSLRRNSVSDYTILLGTENYARTIKVGFIVLGMEMSLKHFRKKEKLLWRCYCILGACCLHHQGDRPDDRGS